MGNTGRELAEYARSLLSNIANTWYMYGNNGKLITEEFIQIKKAQYPARYSDAHVEELRRHIGQVGYDCSSPADLFTRMDKSANGWLETAQKSGTIDTIPEVLGVTVHYPGHMGYYVGGGYVVEARGTWSGIVLTKLINRPWEHWAMIAGVDYTQESDDMIYCQKGQGSKENPDPDVYEMQKGFDELGVPMVRDGVTYHADGSYGGATTNGVKAFEAKYGLLATDGTKFMDTHCTMLYKQLRLLRDKQVSDAEKATSEAKVQTVIATSKYKNLKDNMQNVINNG